MAESVVIAVVSPILKLVIDKLNSGFCKELGSVWGVSSDVKRLQSVLSTINDVLDDAERRSIGNKSLTDWLRKLKDAAFDTNDVVDEFQYEALRRRIQGRNQLIGKVSDFFSLNNQIAFHRKIAHKIKKINKSLGDIADEKSKFHLEGGSTSGRTLDRETFSDVIESEVYGRDQDKEKIINFLVNADDCSDVSVLPIVGLGGLGKTTLAQLAYNDQCIDERFDLKLWACVSDDFNIKGIIKNIIECAGDKCNFSSLEAAKLQLQKKLSGRKFLLVLDDVWNEDEAKWERLKTLLIGGEQGSKIITTTRSYVVARIMGTVAPHELQVLTTDHCWILFKQRAFGPGREETPRLIEIGKEIVQKCRGLPLAAKALGSLMRFKTEEAEWVHVRDSEFWRLPRNENGILPELQLSYDHLPSHLKQCFTYCSIFPKDYEIDRKQLIQLWIAEGFIQTSDGDMHEEEVANQYFNNLLWRSFFQDTRKDLSNNIIRSCKMHDLVHDLACSIARYESSIMKVGMKSSIPHGCRYLSIVYDYTMSSTTSFDKAAFEAKKLRSLILLGPDFRQWIDIKEFAFYAMSSLTRLRALQLPSCDINELPCTISKLKHLRFLDLSGTEIESLPGSITDLHNLQTLNLAWCGRLQRFPEGMSNMSNLRHLDIKGCFGLICMPRWLGRLSNLQTMPMFVVGKEHGHNISELEHLNLISGHLEISKLSNVLDPMEATKANLASKTNLHSLKLIWDGGSNMESATSPVPEVEEVFERLQPHSNLKKLKIRCYPGTKFPTWMTRMELALSPIRNLVRIELQDLQRCECLPTLGHLPSLQKLSIFKMNALRRIGVEFYGDGGIFPSLRSLYMRVLKNLEEWSTEATATGQPMMAFPCLLSFTLAECPKLRIAPRVPPSVVDVSIGDDGPLSAVSTSGLYKLRSLRIWDCEALMLSSWWEWMQDLTALTRLYIHDNKSMCLPESVLQLRMPCGWEWMQDLTALTYLLIIDVKLKSSLPEGILQLRMPSLQHIFLRCWNLKSISGEERDKQQQPPTFFITIQHLDIEGLELTALPEWLGNLTSLKYLFLNKCLNLVTLPDGLQRLTMLQSLRIHLCSPQLGRRCERERGEDWPKIAHIPYVHIVPAQRIQEEREENSQRSITIIR